MRIATRLRSTKTSERRILVIVGNDLTGDSRVQKIIRASLDDGNDTWVLARKPQKTGIPEGLEKANFLRVSFNAQSPHLDFGYELKQQAFRFYQPVRQLIKHARRTLKIAKSKVIKFFRSMRIQIIYRKRRTVYHLKRAIGKLLYSPLVPKQLHNLRSKLLGPRRARIEIKRAEIAEERTNAFFESIENRMAKDIIYPDFGDYLERMYSWFIKPAIKSKPDLIHANDADTLRIAIAVKDYWKEKDHHVAVVYDAHEYTAGVHRPNPSWKPVMIEQECKYILRSDAVVTVSETIALMLMEEFELPTLPSVVLNAPSREVLHDDLPFPTLRQSLELAPEVPIFTYVGVTAPARGIHTVIEALVHSPESHFALITNSNNYVVDCLQIARDLGVSDRVHLKPYVPHQWVSAYISDSTAGINPAVHHPNHELSCSTKYYEYIHARLPIVMSDLKVMAQVTREKMIGEVFVAEDSLDCARAMNLIVKSIPKYTANITDELVHEWSWEKQAETLSSLYGSLMGKQRL
jgi:glycogen(starch) synthase